MDYQDGAYDYPVYIEEMDFGVAYYSKINSNFIVVPYGNEVEDFELFIENSGLLQPLAPLRKWNAETVYLCIHISSQCNLQCDYCFKKEREPIKITINDIRKFIDSAIEIFPDANRYVIDMSGSGEPLLNISYIKEVSELCIEYSDRYLREFQPRLVTNGTMLTVANIKFLQDAKVLFGVSIDGDRRHHDLNRKDKSGNGTYNKIIANIKKIENRNYVGAAVTLTSGNCNILGIVKKLIKYFPTIAIKPVRYTDGRTFDYLNINYEYDRFYEFLLRKSLYGDLRYLFAILNGDDYFGKYLSRVFLNKKARTRCDAGVTRLSLASNGKIYVCPSAVDIDDFVMGDIKSGLPIDQIQRYEKRHFNCNDCDSCYARYICGGRCMVERFYNIQNFSLCEINRHLYKLAVKFYCATVNTHLYHTIIELLYEINGYSKRDEVLFELAKKYEYKYTFSELKSMKDNDKELFSELENTL